MSSRQLNSFIEHINQELATPFTKRASKVPDEQLHEAVRSIGVARDLLDKGNTEESSWLMTEVVRKAKSWPTSDLANELTLYSAAGPNAQPWSKPAIIAAVAALCLGLIASIVILIT